MPARKTTPPRAKQRSQLNQKTKPQQKEPLLAHLPVSKRSEIFGVILFLFASLTIISLISQSTSSVLGWWARSIGKLIGWGVYILPVLLFMFGIVIFFKHKKSIPNLSTEQTTGIFIFLLNLLTWFHTLLDGDFSDAASGKGGGYFGSGIKIGLFNLLGKPGVIVTLVAWLLISTILIFDFRMDSFLSLIKTLIVKLSHVVNKVIEKVQFHFRGQKSSSSFENKIELLSDAEFQLAPPENAQTQPEGVHTAAHADEPIEPVWVLPNREDILDPVVAPADTTEDDQQRARVIEETLRSFGAPAHVVEIKRGPTVTLFGVEPDFIATRNGKTRVRVSKITALSDDIALALAAARIRIQAPVPGKGYIGIEVPNRHVSTVSLQEVLDSPAYLNLNSPLKIPLGKDVSGNPLAADLTAMPHLLIAGTTGAGKSVCINDILVGFLLTKTPDELRMILVDPKRVELTGYNGIPHLLSPVIVNAEHVVGALQWMMREMDNRYRKFSETNTRNIADYNLERERNHEKKLPYLLVVIDELSDLMMLAPDETERAITRLAQLARATGIHLILATQRPSTDILTGLIKANFPARIAFAVASSVDSRVILDQPGAERLLGRGDMLFLAPDAPAPVRIQSAFVSDTEINRLSSYWRAFTVSPQSPQRPDLSAAFQSDGKVPFKQVPLWEEVEENIDPKFKEALEIVRQEGQASVSMLQRKMRIGYTRAARLIENMQQKGILSEPNPKTQIRTFIEPNSDNSSGN